MTENILFPGRPDYTGPTTGVFFAVHHDRICEHSYDIMNRVRYIKKYKAKNEIEIRLHNLMYLGGCEAAAKRAQLDADYLAKCAQLDADYDAECEALYADYEAKCAPLDAEILAYVRQHIPDCAWDEKEGELRFA